MYNYDVLKNRGAQSSRKQKKENKMKKIISLVLTLAMMLALAATITSCDIFNKNSDPVVKVIDVKLTDEEYAFVCKKGNTELVNSFNAFLAEIKSNGTFDTLVNKYFKGEGEKVGYDVDTANTTNTAENLIVVTNCPFEPFEYIGDDGKIYGLDIEIAAAYAQSKNLTLVIKNIGFDEIFTQVEAGYADIGMAGITVSEDRAAIYDFTNTYYQASQKIIVAADNTAFDACTTAEEVEAVLASLQGQKIGYQTGTTGGMYINGDEDWGYTGFANIEGKGYATAQDALQDLINGNIYGVVVDEAPGAALANAVNGN
jgi:polar amino acid transport system substrate-binding protein